MICICLIEGAGTVEELKGAVWGVALVASGCELCKAAASFLAVGKACSIASGIFNLLATAAAARESPPVDTRRAYEHKHLAETMDKVWCARHIS